MESAARGVYRDQSSISRQTEDVMQENKDVKQNNQNFGISSKKGTKRADSSVIAKLKQQLSNEKKSDELWPTKIRSLKPNRETLTVTSAIAEDKIKISQDADSTTEDYNEDNTEVN